MQRDAIAGNILYALLSPRSERRYDGGPITSRVHKSARKLLRAGLTGCHKAYKLKKFILVISLVFTRFALLPAQPILLIFPILTAQLG